MKKELLRNLPKIDVLLHHEDLKNYSKKIEYHLFLASIKDGIEYFRKNILNDKISSYSEKEIIKKIKDILERKSLNNLKKVINGTGIIIHTNLGRSIFSKEILKKSFDTLTSYNNLELDLITGKRGSRNSHLENLICEILNVEAALVVNNNAAAVLLCLNEFAKNKEVIVSRGELVEIGGSFRIPKIMEFAGAKLIEVGSTNKTYISDYKEAINDETKILLKIHTSNYKILGFTHEIERENIVSLAKEKNIISMEDIGSGNLINFSKYKIKKEITVQEVIKSGMDIITFSGDKLFGGPQAGIIVGKKMLIDRLKKNQYLRTIRIDKITISILENIFNLYRDEKKAILEIPTLKYLTEDISKIQTRAEKLSLLLKEKNIKNEIINSSSYIGGGSMPEEKIESFAVKIVSNISANQIKNNLLNQKIPVIGRIEKNSFLIDMRAIDENEIELIGRIIYKAFLEIR